MDRRDALKSLTALAGSVGLSVTPITTVEAQAAELIILRATRPVSAETMWHIREHWMAAVEGTGLDGCRCVVLDDSLEVQLVKRAK